MGLAGMPAAMTPGATGFEATPIEPTIASASILTPERTTAWYVMRARSPITVLPSETSWMSSTAWAWE